MIESGSGTGGLPPSRSGGAGGDADESLSCRVLIVEDDADNRELISLFLTLEGAEVATAEDGVAAVDQVRRARAERSTEADREPFDLILMDMQMPGMNGYEATKALRNMGCTTPIVALTAMAREGDRERSIGVGCNEHISKPVKRKSLLNVVRQFVGSTKQSLRGKPSSASHDA